MRTILAAVLLFVAVPSVASATCYDWPLRGSQPAYDGDQRFGDADGARCVGRYLLRELPSKPISESSSGIDPGESGSEGVAFVSGVDAGVLISIHLKIDLSQQIGDADDPRYWSGNLVTRLYRRRPQALAGDIYVHSSGTGGCAPVQGMVVAAGNDHSYRPPFQ